MSKKITDDGISNQMTDKICLSADEICLSQFAEALDFERKWRLKFAFSFVLGIVAVPYCILLSKQLSSSFTSWWIFATSCVVVVFRTLLETTIGGEDLRSVLLQCRSVLGGFVVGGITPMILETSLETTRFTRIALSVVLAAYALIEYRWYQTNLLQLAPISNNGILVICVLVSIAVGIPT